MRTDVKIILVVVAVLVVLGAIWFAMYYHPAKPAPKPEEQAVAPPEGINVIEEPATAPSGFEAVTTASGTGPTPEYGRLETPRRIGEPNAPSPTVEMKTYVVRPGDTYPSIARRELGSAALAHLIEQANPNIPARSLRTGLTIKLPPPSPPPTLSTETLAPPSRTGEAVAPGTTGTDPATGKRFYVVKQGENGFSGVAAAVYGNGRHWKVIEDANPGVKSTGLQPGQKLWAPELPRVEGATITPEGVRPALTATGLSTAHRTAPSATTSPPGTRVRTGAPVGEKLPDGRSFD